MAGPGRPATDKEYTAVLLPSVSNFPGFIFRLNIPQNLFIASHAEWLASLPWHVLRTREVEDELEEHGLASKILLHKNLSEVEVQTRLLEAFPVLRQREIACGMAYSTSPIQLVRMSGLSCISIEAQY